VMNALHLQLFHAALLMVGICVTWPIAANRDYVVNP